jgi:lysophospholipid acyltransferase (LPLAT)-like uncharacterized protein
MTNPTAVLDRKTRALLVVGRMVIRGLAATWRYSVKNGTLVENLRRNGRPIVFGLWHGQMLPLVWLHRNQGVAVVISAHRDGELIAQVCESLGFRTIRGSSSRGGERALLRAIRELKGGGEVAFTPDGPRGPSEVFAPGAAAAVMRGEATFVAVAMNVKRAWHLSSWDRFTIPKPFSRISVAYAVNPETVIDVRAQIAQLEHTMRLARERAGG